MSDAGEGYRAILLWASTPQSHGGTNPYGQPNVINAERKLAKIENREIEDWAKTNK